MLKICNRKHDIYSLPGLKTLSLNSLSKTKINDVGYEAQPDSQVYLSC